MHLPERTIAALAIAAYLAAALIPCEPPAERRGAEKGVHGVAIAPTTPPASPAPMTDHGGMQPEAHHGAGGHAAHGGGHEADSPRPTPSPSVGERRGSSPGAVPVLVAKCLCGCSETRSWVGGGSARLGSVVPARVTARLIEADPVVAVDRSQPRFVQVFAEAEPIPI